MPKNSEIKFRFVYYRKADDKLCYQFYTLEEILDGKYTEYKILHEGFVHQRTDRFTGLRDNGGFNIYENDQLKNKESDLISKVIHNDGTFWIENEKFTEPLGSLKHDVEIIREENLA